MTIDVPIALSLSFVSITKGGEEKILVQIRARSRRVDIPLAEKYIDGPLRGADPGTLESKGMQFLRSLFSREESKIP